MQLTHLKEGDDLRDDGLNQAVQLLGVNLRAAHISRRAFCHNKQLGILKMRDVLAVAAAVEITVPSVLSAEFGCAAFGRSSAPAGLAPRGLNSDSSCMRSYFRILARALSKWSAGLPVGAAARAREPTRGGRVTNLFQNKNTGSKLSSKMQFRKL